MDRLLGYTHQSLSNLGSGKRIGSHGPVNAAIPINGCKSFDNVVKYVRAAVTAILMKHLDSYDLVLAEAPGYFPEDPEATLLQPFRAKLDRKFTWAQLVQDLHKQAESKYTESLISLFTSRRLLKLPESSVVFPAVFIWDEFDDIEQDSYLNNGVLVGVKCNNKDPALFDLHLIGDSYLISQETLELLSQNISLCVQQALAYPDSSPITNLFPDSIPSEIASSHGKTENNGPAHLALDWLSKQAKERPDSVAHEVYDDVDEEPSLLTYKQLEDYSNGFAQELIDKYGIKFEDKIAVCSNRNESFYIAMAAIMKAGACYVSIDPDLPEERKLFIAENSDAVLILSNYDQYNVFDEKYATVKLDKDQMKPSEIRVCNATLDSLSYLLYTSGTTGTPKGCLLNHRGLYWAIDAMCAYPRRVTEPEKDKRLALASVAFDVHISEIIQCWSLGIRLVSAPRAEILADLRNKIKEIGITHLGMVPSMIESLLISPDDLPLKYMVSGGEKASDSMLEKWTKRSNLLVANFYGPTEATIGCTSRLMNTTDRKENIGFSFPGSTAYVINPSNMSIVPRGIPGELIIEGPLVGRGYHRLPEATKKAFIEFPGPGCKAYRTGDLVRMMSDGSIEIMGRIDSQIKLRGVRIEVDGISSVLRQATLEIEKEKNNDQEVNVDVTTLVSSHPKIGNETLVSFVSKRSKHQSMKSSSTAPPSILSNEQDMVRNLKKASDQQLAVYMRPSYIIPLSHIPFNLNGKSDAKLLRTLFSSAEVDFLISIQGNDD